MTERLHFYFSPSCIGEENGNPLQCSGLENPRDGGAWWAAIYWVSQSRTRLKRLSSSSSSSVLFISVCLFSLISCRSLVNISCLFSLCLHSFPKTLDHLHYHYAEILFSGRLPISTSFGCFSGVLSCPFIWDITFCFFILVNFL